MGRRQVCVSERTNHRLALHEFAAILPLNNGLSRHSISTFIKTLAAQGKVIDLHATDRVIVSIIFGLVLGLAAIAIVIAIAFPFLIIGVFHKEGIIS